MPTYMLTVHRDVREESGRVTKRIKIVADTAALAIKHFMTLHPHWYVENCDRVIDTAPPSKSNSPAKVRGTYKARMCQMRNSLQAMLDSEDHLLTEEELVQINRTICKLNRIISLFHVRTMDMKREGKL